MSSFAIEKEIVTNLRRFNTAPPDFDRERDLPKGFMDYRDARRISELLIRMKSLIQSDEKQFRVQASACMYQTRQPEG